MREFDQFFYYSLRSDIYPNLVKKHININFQKKMPQGK